MIYNGSKIMHMELAKGLHIRVLDSLNFLPMKLAALPKAFGLTKLCKGYFPHFFNKRENQHYVGPYPDPKAYGADFMSTEDKKAFLGTRQNEMPYLTSRKRWRFTAGPMWTFCEGPVYNLGN